MILISTLLVVFFGLMIIGANYNSAYNYKGFSNRTIKRIRKGLKPSKEISDFKSAIFTKENATLPVVKATLQ